jgi:hypothetical protein
MSTLSGQKIKDKFGNLLQVEGGVTSSTKNVEDGTGDATALKLSTTEVEINGTQSFTAAPTTDNSEATGLFINGSNEVVKRELAATAFTTDVAPYPESVVGYVATPLTLSDTAQTITFADPDNSTENSSYHFGQAPADFRFDPAAGTIENISAEPFPIRVSITSALEVNSNNTVIQYTLQRATGAGAFSNVKRVIREKANIGASRADSFWGIFILQPTQKIRVQVFVSAGSADILAGTELEVFKKEAGNII